MCRCEKCLGRAELRRIELEYDVRTYCEYPPNMMNTLVRINDRTYNPRKLQRILRQGSPVANIEFARRLDKRMFASICHFREQWKWLMRGATTIRIGGMYSLRREFIWAAGLLNFRFEELMHTDRGIKYHVTFAETLIKSANKT